MQVELLDAPACDFGGKDFVFATAIHGVNGGEFFNLLAGFAELAEDSAAQFHFIDLAADGIEERIVVVGIRIRTVKILVRARSDTYSPGCAYVIVDRLHLEIVAQ